MTAPMVIEGALTGEMFLAYVEQCLVPTLRRDNIVVMDNCRIHLVAGVREAIEKARAGNIAGMGEVVGAFPSTDLRYERTNCAVETRNGARGNLAQRRFEFAVGQL